MKVSNFRNRRKVNRYVFADIDIDVKKGIFSNRKTTHIIYRHTYSTFWRFLDSGNYTPTNIVERLESAYDALKELKELEEIGVE